MTRRENMLTIAETFGQLGLRSARITTSDEAYEMLPERLSRHTTAGGSYQILLRCARVARGRPDAKSAMSRATPAEELLAAFRRGLATPDPPVALDAWIHAFERAHPRVVTLERRLEGPGTDRLEQLEARVAALQERFRALCDDLGFDCDELD